jgi:hypothetical protein
MNLIRGLIFLFFRIFSQFRKMLCDFHFQIVQAFEIPTKCNVSLFYDHAQEKSMKTRASIKKRNQTTRLTIDSSDQEGAADLHPYHNTIRGLCEF